jgi:hypothetical protein
MIAPGWIEFEEKFWYSGLVSCRIGLHIDELLFTLTLAGGSLADLAGQRERG